MRKIVSVLLYVIAVLLLIGSYTIHYFTNAKMGMARYMVYFNNKIDSRIGGSFRVKSLFIIIILIICVATAVTSISIFRVYGRVLLIAVGVSATFNIYALCYVVLFNKSSRDYYANSILYIMVSAILFFSLTIFSKRKVK